MNYGFHFEGRTYFPDGSEPAEETHESAEQRNRARSAAELAAFRQRTDDRWVVYVQPFPGGTHDGTEAADGELTTWMGDRLATFVWSGPEYRCGGFGGAISKRRNLRARGIDGREWYGTAYLSSGDYARIRVAKGRLAA